MKFQATRLPTTGSLFDQLHAAPDVLKQCLFDMLTKGPAWVVDRRAKLLKKWTQGLLTLRSRKLVFASCWTQRLQRCCRQKGSCFLKGLRRGSAGLTWAFLLSLGWVLIWWGMLNAREFLRLSPGPRSSLRTIFLLPPNFLSPPCWVK